MAELEQLSANPSRPAAGTVIEAHLDRRSGPCATVIVAAGTLRPGDIVVAGTTHGRVRTMADAAGGVDEAGPSRAVRFFGLDAVPTAGDTFEVCDSETEARKRAEAADTAARLDRLQAQAGDTRVTTMSLASLDDDEGEALQRLNVILKADASGAAEAVKAAAGALPQDRVSVRFLLAAANEITLSDVDLAYASEALVVGFNVTPSEAVSAAAKQAGVEIVTYRVIYDLVDDLRARMEGRLAAVDERQPLGAADVRAVFGAGARRVAGCLVTDGVIKKGCLAVVKRKKRVVAEGAVVSLRRVKDDVKQVDAGVECGISVAGFSDWQEGDSITTFDVVSKQRTLEEASEEVAALAAALTAPAAEEE